MIYLLIRTTMNYIRFKKKKVNITVYFGSKPNTDWSMVKECQKLKESHSPVADDTTE